MTRQLPTQPTTLTVSRSLGTGGQAQIFETVLDEQPVALKVYDPKDYGAIHEISPRSEFELLTKLRACPYVLKPIEFCPNASLQIPNSLPQDEHDSYAAHRSGYSVKDNASCMAVELCRCDLFDLISKTGALGDKQLIVSLFTQLCTAVSALHEQGYSHLDLKLENCLIGQDYTLRLCDFGFAQPNDRPVTRVYGTEGFMAPEILDTTTTFANYDGTQADIYSLGVILYIMVFGKPPFGRAHVSDRFFKLRVERADKFFRLHPTTRPLYKEGLISESLQHLLIRLLSTDLASERPKTIAELLADPWFGEQEPISILDSATRLWTLMTV